MLEGYPDCLLPKTNYQIISEGFDGCCLVRRYNLNQVPVFKDDNGRVYSKAIFRSSNQHDPDLSVNLLGVFLQEHLELRAASAFNEPWEVGQNVEPPKKENEDYFILQDVGSWYAEIEKINGLDFSYKFLKDKNWVQRKARFKVKHSPTRCNFWHLSILIEILNGDNWISTFDLLEAREIKPKKAEDKAIAKTAVLALSPILKKGVPSIVKKLEPEFYTKAS